MLNIGRVGPGGEKYYLSQVVSGLEDYYVEGGEAPGRWIGAIARELELTGGVRAADLKRVLAARDPRDDALLSAHPARKVAGFDLALRAPKSVSLAWALTDDPQVADQIKRAHAAAVDAAVGYLEREAGFTRRGAGGSERLQGAGFVAAAFDHRTSREGDPLLHTHVLVANLTRTLDDGVWRTLDSRGLYKHAKTAGFLYQAQLRYELTERLGLAWQPVVNGHADLDGFDRPLIEAFSRRRAQIVERLDELGMDSPEAAQIATYATRKPKQLVAPETELRAGWVRRARELGFDPPRLAQLLHAVEPGRWELRVDRQRLADLLAADGGLTAHAATFARRDAVQAVAAALPEGGTVDEIEALTDQLLEDGRLVAVGTGPRQLSLLHRTPTDVDDPVRYTTAGLLAVEADAIDVAVARRDDDVATVNPSGVELLIRRHRELGADQVAAVRALTTSGRGVEVVVGKAGSGKTHMLKVAREAWQIGGVAVIGCSLAARAARGLEEASGIPSTTLARLLAACDAPVPGSPLPPNGVVVVDEAGMVGTRQLARLLNHAHRQGTKVVLVGDPAQLPEIDAGGLFRGLCTRLDVHELAVNRRQASAWERAIVDRLREGHTREAVTGYAEHGRLTVLPVEGLLDRVVDDWKELADEHGGDHVVIIARTRAQVDHLNAAVRRRLIEAGALGAEVRTARGRKIAVGERVICLRNDRRLGVDNGTRGTVTAVHPVHGVTIQPDGRDVQVTLPASYLDDGLLDHGYAITGHKAQGLTVDHALVVADEMVDGDWGYVAMSRGRHTNHLYVPDPNASDPRRHAPEPREDASERLARRLRVTRADTPLRDRDVYDATETALRWQRLTARIGEARQVDRRRETLEVELGTLAKERAHLEARSERARAAVAEASGGLSRLSRSRRRERDDAVEALERFQHRAEQLDQREGELRRQLDDLGPRADVEAWRQEADRLRAVLDGIAEQTARGCDRDPPGWLTSSLGPPPEHPAVRVRWLDAATDAHGFRLRWQIDDPDHALGDSISPDPLRQERSLLASRLREASRTIEELEHPELVRSRTLGISR